MTYHMRRINPYWHAHPMIPTGVAIGVILAVMGIKSGNNLFAILGGVAAGIALLAATRPAVSAVLATLGIFGGLVTFILMPNPQAAVMSFGTKLLSVGLFAVFYMVLMDALVLVIAVLYNLFSETLGLGGVRLDLESEEQSAEEA